MKNRPHDLEHGVIEAADIQDVSPLERLRRAVRLDVAPTSFGLMMATASLPNYSEAIASISAGTSHYVTPRLPPARSILNGHEANSPPKKSQIAKR